jgi:hypothetical protein
MTQPERETRKNTPARKQADDATEAPRDTGADWPSGVPGLHGTEDQPNFYREVGVKESRGLEEKYRNEPPEADLVDKSDADAHQAEGPGGKG